MAKKRESAKQHTMQDDKPTGIKQRRGTATAQRQIKGQVTMNATQTVQEPGPNAAAEDLGDGYTLIHTNEKVKRLKTKVGTLDLVTDFSLEDPYEGDWNQCVEVIDAKGRLNARRSRIQGIMAENAKKQATKLGEADISKETDGPAAA